MFMVASAEEVARREPSGENLREVMPRAWALEIVRSGLKRKVLGRAAGCGEYGSDAGSDASADDCGESDLRVESLESLRLERLLCCRGGLLFRQKDRGLSSPELSREALPSLLTEVV